jgi:glycosyltransferase involved in cell wall biosynthesis
MRTVVKEGPGRVAVVIPARNEELSIGPVVAEVRRLHPDFEVLVIDDASTDSTCDAALDAGATVLSAPIGLGYGGAVHAGMKFAYARDYDLVVLMDADGQHDPAYIGTLLEGARHYDMVIGSRFMGVEAYDIPVIRRLGMRVFSGIASGITGQRISDTSSGFQALRRNVFGLFAKGAYPVDFPDADTIIWVARHGFRVGEVAVKMHARTVGTSMISGLGASLKYALKMPLSILVTLLRIPSSHREGEAP